VFVFVNGGLSRFVGLHARVNRAATLAAATAETASALDAPGASVVASAIAVETAIALDLADAVSVVPATALEAANALDEPDAVSIGSAIAVEAADARDELDAVSITSAIAVEAANASDELDAAIGAQVLFGTVDEPAAALDELDAIVVPLVAVGSGGGIARPPRPFPVDGYGYGILPQLEGEAHGVVLAAGAGIGALPVPDAELAGAIGAAGRSLALLDVRGAASGDRGQAGAADGVLKGIAVTGSGAAVVRGKGLGMIIKLTGAANGRHDDDEAAAVAWLLAA
jgi:hypothetical protein